MALYVREYGPAGAPTIVLLHGGFVSGRMWEPQIADLQADYHLLVPDLPEHGRSVEVKPFTMRGAAECVVELIRTRAHGGRCHLVGLSLGAQVTIQLLSLAPEVVESAVATGTLAECLPGSSLAPLLALVSLPAYRIDWLARRQARQAGIPDEYLDVLREEGRTVRLGSLARVLRANMTAGLPAGLERVRAPVLILGGEKEVPLVFSSMQLLTAAIPGAQGYRVAGVGHPWSAQAPGLFTRVVRAWIAGQPLPPELTAP